MRTSARLSTQLLAIVFLASLPLLAQEFTGTNSPGAATNFTFSVEPGATNLSLALSGSSGAWSWLLLKKGAEATELDFDFASRLDSANNRINLEPPEFEATNYGLRVVTPPASGTHEFTATLTTNRTDLRASSYPVLKPLVFSTTGVLSNSPSGAWHYFQVDVPTNLPGWRIVLSASTPNTPDLYVGRGYLPVQYSYTKGSAGQSVDTLAYPADQATAGTYFIGVFLPETATGNSVYALSAELGCLTELAWDAGTSHEGTTIFTNTSPTGGDYFFKIVTQNTAVGGWRVALNVQSGEADAYLAYSSWPSTSSYSYASTRAGSDGFVLVQGYQFAQMQEWYLLVHATPGAQWKVVSGETYVRQLPDLAPDASSGGTFTMGAEGMSFFKTTISAGTPAWRLGLSGLNNQVLVKKTAIPHPYGSGACYDWGASGQMLLVPPYLNVGDQYIIGVVGDPGLGFTLDSRQQPIADFAFGSATNFTVSAGSFGFATFRVQVPVEQIAWQLNVIPSSGNANLAIRRDNVPNQFVNDAFSDLPGTTGDSVTLVPPTLSDGVFYVTVYGSAPFTCSLTNGMPVITDVNYVFSITNDAPTRAGWRYYRVADIDEQLGTLGWDLFLQNQPPGTEIALRLSAVPGRWNYRNFNSEYYSSYSGGYVDYSGPNGYLQRPNHQAQIWYIGVYSPAFALGNFVLTGRELNGDPLAFDGAGSSVNITNQPLDKWQYFRVVVPDTSNVLGWDLRLTNVTSGNPHMVVRRDLLPADFGTTWQIWGAPGWPSGGQWAPDNDWTSRSYSPDGLVYEGGRILAVGMGNPLSPGTYYIGVQNGYSGNTPMSYTLVSRGIGDGLAIPVQDLAFTGGSVSSNTLPAREAAYYRMVVPTNTPSWRLKLSTNSGEAMLIVRTDTLPNVWSARVVKKSGDEHYLRLPDNLQTNVPPGTYYLTVISEGNNPAASDRIGTGSVDYTLSSLGPLVPTDIGTLDSSGATDLVQAGSQAGGVVKAFQFTVPPGTLAFDLTLEDCVGNPMMSLHAGDQLPAPYYVGYFYGWSGYSWDGGQPPLAVDSSRISVPNPTPGPYTLTVEARTDNTGAYPDASYHIRVHAKLAPSVAFDGGSLSFTNQAASVWQYFRIEVPSDAMGWDLRLVNVTSGTPVMAVSRDLLPTSLGGTWGWGPAANTSWPSGYQWTPHDDGTGCVLDSTGTRYEHGRILTAGMGNPLEPGTYYVGVRGDDNPYDTNPMSYTLVSRGIGTNYSIGIQDLAFTNGVASSNGLPARSWAYYRVEVPTNVPSWKLRLTNDVGDTTLVIRKDGLPATDMVGNVYLGGIVLRKTGDEQLLLMPPQGQSNVLAGTYYLAVVSQGENSIPDASWIGTNGCSFTLTSQGVMSITDLGAVDPSGLTDVVHLDSQAGAESKAFQFTVQPGTLSLEVRLQNVTGHPSMSLRADSQLPVSFNYWEYGYGQFWGQPYEWRSTSLINLANPLPGVYTIMVQAGAPFADASYAIRLHALGALPLAFDGGAVSITNQAPDTWQYFLLTVPPGAMGWDLRITNVTSGSPDFVVCRDQLPSGFGTTFWTGGNNWPSTSQWGAGGDWCEYNYDWNWAGLQGRHLVMSMGNPLEPGSYYIGVADMGSAQPCSYTLVSRGIGESLSIPVGALAFSNGVVSDSGLPVLEAAFYRVEVPATAPNWKLRLAADAGETMLMMRQGGLPNSANYSRVQKAGTEQYLRVPDAGQTTIPGGTYYLAVVSEGMNPDANNRRLGTNTSSYTLTSSAEFAITNLGTLGGTDLVRTDALDAGEVKAYQFTIPPGTLAVEVRLDDRVGYPRMMLVVGNEIPHFYNQYGFGGGVYYNWYSQSLITLPKPAANIYTLSVEAESSGGAWPDAQYTVVVHPLPTPELNFDASLNTNGLSNAASGFLADGQRAFYKVAVPATLNGAPVLGWKLNLVPSLGTPQMSVAKDTLPNGNENLAGEAIYVSPVLTPGTWYVSVLGQGASTYTLTSSALAMDRPPWTMPAVGQAVITLGLPPSGPLFGDTGVDTNGMALPDDQGTDLEQGRLHYYTVLVPSNNVGLLRTRLDAISGNPNLYLRVGVPPTLSHGTYTYPYWGFDRYLGANVGSEYGNWVPLNGRYEAFLTPGTWYLAVHAAGGSNVRYRLRLSTGNIQDLSLNGGPITNTLAATDWGYYRVQIPSNAPVNWTVTFNQLVGDAVMYVRDTTPPGMGWGLGYGVYDWNQDGKNHGPYPYFDTPGTYTLNTPPLRPGAVYYLGFRAVSDATFSVSSATSGGTIDVTNTLAFYGGTFTNEIPPYGAVQFRIDVPANARRWIHTAAHNGSVWQYLEQGTIPTPVGFNWSSYGSASVGFNLDLYTPNNWPWLPGYSYFLLVTNTSATPQAFAMCMDGRNCANDDADGDGLPDCWEVTYWPNPWYYGPNDDPDHDDVTNLQEYLDGTDPTDPQSFRPRLTIIANGGTVMRDPDLTNYAYGATVTLTALPDPGAVFTGWSQDATGTNNPVVIAMNGHQTVQANFTTTGCSNTPAGMVAWWQYENNTLDSAGSHTGILHNGATFAPGKVSQALDLSAPNSYVEVPDSPAWAFGADEFTIELWANFNSAGGSQAFLASDTGGGSTDKWIFWLDGGGLRFHINGSPGSVNLGSAVFSPEIARWYHIALTRSADTYTFFIDGTAVSTNTDSRLIPDASAPLTIGLAEGWFYFNGLLDDIAIYNRALTRSEIKFVFDAGSGGKCSPPPNDDFANRSPLVGYNVTTLGYSRTATAETGEPNHVGNTPTKSVWWTWTAPADGTVEINTTNSTFDTLLSVYTNSTLDTLGVVAECDDIGGGVTTSSVLFDCAAGVSYQIAVDGFSGESGSIVLNLAFHGLPGVPSADYRFQNNLASSIWTPPDLTFINSEHHFTNLVVDGFSHTVLRFEQGSGLQLQPASAVFPSDSYSIVILAKFDQVSYWRRILDFKNQTSDNGLYTHQGELTFYSDSSSGACLANDTWHQITITRDAATSEVVLYGDGVYRASFFDYSGDGVISPDNALRFFKDNNSYSEETGSYVARIRTFATPLAPAEVAALDRFEGGTVVPLPADYRFQNNLASSVNSPPALSFIGASLYFTNLTFDDGQRTVLRFEQGTGLQLQPTAGIAPNNVYTIAMLYRFDTVSGWRRILDTKNVVIDEGLYALSGSLNFYPGPASGGECMTNDTWHQVVVTRDASDQVEVYCDGVPQLSFVDSSGYGLITGDQTLRFFKDDDTEDSGGYVGRLRTFPTALTPQEVAALNRFEGDPLPPPNDMFTNRLLLAGTGITTDADNRFATREPGEPPATGSGTHSVWWTWVAPADGTLTADTIGSSFDTVLAIYLGDTLASLTLLAGDDNSGGNWTSRASLPVLSGQSYHIAVDGYNAYSAGSIQLHLSFTAPPSGLQVYGVIGLEGYLALGGEGMNLRDVVCTATDDWGTVLRSWTNTLDFTPGPHDCGISGFMLTGVPENSSHLSAKTAWHLRKRVTLVFTDGAAPAFFTGDSRLLAGDIDGSNMVDIGDYYRLAASWYLPDLAADIDGDGLVDLDDYFLLSSHWLQAGDPE